MKKVVNKRKKRIIEITAECCRILLGLTFVFSGIVKAIDPVGGALKIEEYLVVFGLDSFGWLSISISIAQSVLEFTLGFCLLMGVYRRLTTLFVLIFMCFFTPLTFYIALFNPVADCGCFGDALIITNWQTFFKNIVLLAASIFVYIHCKRLISIYSYRTYWFVALFACIFGVSFCYYNYSHLPIIDFLPYKVGENIPKLMEIPPDAPRDEYHYIYRKDGVKKEFALADAPVSDSTWTYVDSKLIKAGFVPKVGSFELYNKNQDNVADRMLVYPEAVFLLILPDLKKANDEHIDPINDVYDYAVENHLLFYGVTASSEESIAEWSKYTGTEYPFLTADDVLLKSMIRSNPGLVLLKEGTILAKWHHNDIPGGDELAGVMAGYLGDASTVENEAGTDENISVEQVGNHPCEKNDGIWLRIIAGFALPLLLIWVYDFLRNGKNRKRKRNLYKLLKNKTKL